MNQSTTLPKIGLKNASTKDAIISVLGNKWPLPLKEIHSEVKKIVSNDLTYQATHKTIYQLVEGRVLEKIGKNYKLSSNWINSLKDFSLNLEENYSGTTKKYSISPDFQGTTKWHFDDISVFSVEIAKLITNLGKWQNITSGIGLLRHAWWPFNFKFIDFALLINMLKAAKGAHIIIQSDSPFDKWIAKQYLSAGLNHIKIGVKDLNLENDLIFTGETIIQVHFSEETTKLQDEIYSKVHDLGDLMEEFVFNKHSGKKIEIDVQITRNKALAKTMNEQLLEKFFGGKNEL